MSTDTKVKEFDARSVLVRAATALVQFGCDEKNSSHAVFFVENEPEGLYGDDHTAALKEGFDLMLASNEDVHQKFMTWERTPLTFGGSLFIMAFAAVNDKVKAFDLAAAASAFLLSRYPNFWVTYEIRKDEPEFSFGLYLMEIITEYCNLQ